MGNYLLFITVAVFYLMHAEPKRSVLMVLVNGISQYLYALSRNILNMFIPYLITYVVTLSGLFNLVLCSLLVLLLLNIPWGNC